MLESGLRLTQRYPTAIDDLLQNRREEIVGIAQRYGAASRPQLVIIVLLLCLVTALPSSAQELTATFAPQKPVYLLGEPVWFVFRVTNKGSTPFQIENSDPYGVCAFLGGYWFDVPGAKPSLTSFRDFATPWFIKTW
jgi:hypothetical protein